MSQSRSPQAVTHQGLLNAAGAVLARNPGAAMAEIAEKAGVGRATLYRHFPTREDLIRALVLESLRQIDEATQDIAIDRLSAEQALAEIVQCIVPLGDRFRFLANEATVLNDPEIKATYSRQLDELGALVEAMKAEGSLDRAVPTAWVVAAIDALIYAAWNSVDDGAVARRDAAALAFRTVIRGLGPAASAAAQNRRSRSAKR
ncbi:MAG: TetR/AcrR family transcriptional regulator [Pseudomonadota bacterium]